MKKIAKKLTKLILLLACIWFFGCANPAGGGGASSFSNYVVYVYSSLAGDYGDFFSKEVVVKPLDGLPNSMTLLDSIPDAETLYLLKEAFDSGVPVGLINADETKLNKFSELFDLDIDFAGSVTSPSGCIFIARQDEFGNIYSVDVGFDSLVEYNDEPEEVGTEVIPPSEESDKFNDPPEQDPESDEAFKQAVVEEILKWAFVYTPEMIEANASQNSANSVNSAGQKIDLQKIATAYRPRHIINPSQHFGEKRDLFKFPTIVIDYIIYSVHDFDNNNDYYVMEKNTTRDASPYFEYEDQSKGTGNPFDWYKIIHWNAEVKTEAMLDAKGREVQMTQNLPLATRSRQQFTESFNWNIGAHVNVGFSGQKNQEGKKLEIGANAGFGFTKSNTWTLLDLYVEPNLRGKDLDYKYRIPMEQFVPNRDDPLVKVPAIARSTLSTKEMWLWTVINPGETATLKGSDTHTVGRRQYAAFAAGGQRWRYLSKKETYSHPMQVPPHFTFSTPTQTNQIVLDKDGKLLGQQIYAQIGVFAHQAWELASDATWLAPSRTSGSGLTAPNAISLTCDRNGSRNQRTATLTAKTTIEGKEKEIKLEVIQAGDTGGLPAGESFRVSSTSIALDSVVYDPIAIKLSAADNWTARTGDRWCRIYQFEGGPCKDLDFKIGASANTTGEDRSTVVTFTSKTTGKKVEVAVMQYAD